METQLGGAKNCAWCVTDPSLGVCLQNRGDVIIKVRDLEKAQDVAIRYCQPAKDGIIPDICHERCERRACKIFGSV